MTFSFRMRATLLRKASIRGTISTEQGTIWKGACFIRYLSDGSSRQQMDPNANPDTDIAMKFVPGNRKQDDFLGLLDNQEEKEPLPKWKHDNKERHQRFGKNLVSGRGQYGGVADTGARFNFKHLGFRATGLAYHAWENKLKENPLPSMPALDALRQKNASDPLTINESVMNVMLNLETLSGAFLSMYCRHGSPENAKKVLHTKALPWLKLMASKLQNGTYIFPQLSQLEPKKPNSQKSFETHKEVPTWWHKTFPEAVRLTLEAVFEPMFLRSSHGYRPSKGCYTALKEVKHTFAGVDYFLVGDLSPCLENFDQKYLLTAIRDRITDEGFLKLLEDLVRAGYVQLSTVSYRCIGLPQSSLLSPILTNIYLHGVDLWFDDLIKCLTVGGKTNSSTESVHGVLENRIKWGSKRITDFKCWKSGSLKSVRYVRYGNDLLIGVNGLEADMDQLEVDLAKIIQSQLFLDYKKFQYNRAVASSPDKEYVVFLGAEVYVAPQISSPGLSPTSKEAGQLPNRPRLCVPARLLVRKLEESGFINPETKRPRYCNRMVLWECHEIVKYYDIVTKLYCMYYSFADNYHCLMLLFDVMKQSCALTLARKLGLKRIWHVHKHFEKDLIIRDMDGVAIASFEKPIFKRPLDPFIGRDINPFVRIERPSRPKFPPVKLGESFIEPKFPRSKMEIGIEQAKHYDNSKVEQQQ